MQRLVTASHTSAAPTTAVPVVATTTTGDAVGTASAWLHIHAGAMASAAPSRMRAWWQQVCRLASSGGRPGAGQLDIEIHDLCGRRVLAIVDASRTIALTLPPGTYHVGALQCGQRRQYTVALQAGSTVELRLSPAQAAARA